MQGRNSTVAQSHLRSYSRPPVRSDIPLDAEPPDKDTLHKLPLTGMPLVTSGLRKARLIKNSRFEGVIELFSDEKSGSGQISPDRLNEVFQFDGRNKTDLDLIKHLSQLNSYDVYTVRVAMRRLGIEVEDVDTLQLSPELRNRLVPHMRSFTRPLLHAVYGAEQKEPEDLKDLIGLFIAPDMDVARENLARLSHRMRIDVTAIPKFIEDYGDVYLSLAYYQYCLDQNKPQIHSFLAAMEEMQHTASLKQAANLMATCKMLETKITGVVHDIANVLEMFRIRTIDMWEKMSEETFRRMEAMIIGYQTSIGAALCIITVKMNAWNQQFPQKESGGPWSRADFLMTNMRPGLELVQDISYEDPQ
ncbi:hypothetical protein [Pelagibius sp.]|uniref:hypothetical protein n=1 Tax=Pelagibius sp. TaxID=1931238 RepID=UPI003B5149B9